MKKNYMKAMIIGAVALLMFTGSLFTTEMDKRIESSAQNSYVFTTYLKDDAIQVHSQDGAVTLTGTVSEEYHLALAADTVADLPGVISVDNRLELKGAILEKNSDNWVRVRVKSMLRLHRNLDSDNIGVEVRDGRVTLQGEVGSQAERGLIVEYVKDVDGVRDVNSELSVAKYHRKHRSVGQFIDDSSIKSQIKLALLFHRGTNPFRANVSVRRGMVTVTGTAKSRFEKALVTKRIEDIHGVKRIRNRMTIE